MLRWPAGTFLSKFYLVPLAGRLRGSQVAVSRLFCLSKCHLSCDTGIYTPCNSPKYYSLFITTHSTLSVFIQVPANLFQSYIFILVSVVFLDFEDVFVREHQGLCSPQGRGDQECWPAEGWGGPASYQGCCWCHSRQGPGGSRSCW
ncbi:hypothetical protein M758_1G016200 [Ceratodon purpureus]|nr:hypothetical protein M758_1G016200 [Ceratodon purpureus]